MDLGPVLDEFAVILAAYISDADGASFEPHSLSENTVCAFLAAALLNEGVPAHRIQMEVPHPALAMPKGMQKSVDIRAVDASGTAWIEVKFDRPSRNGSQLNEPNRFGNLLKDFVRAGLLPDDGIVFYVTDAKMEQYLNDHSHFCGATSFTVDSGLLQGLPPVAARRIDAGLTSLLDGKTLRFRLIWKHRSEYRSDSLCCFAWKAERIIESSVAEKV